MTPDQAPAPQSFQAFSREIVRGFLQTVVVLDDEAFISPHQPAVGPLVEPDPDIGVQEPHPEDDEAPSRAGARPPGNALDARALINSFAGYGMVCAVLTPWNDDDGDDATVTASQRADIVILDWHLGDQGQRATRIIRRITDEDGQSGGRLRLIAVYTAERDLNGICGHLTTELPAFERYDSTRFPTLVADHARVLIITKGRTAEEAGSVIEADLPDRLIGEFAEIGKGLLANVAFGSIAAIRRDTHRLLARFHSGLDAPFVSHRILLETPEDAEQYALDLLCSELAVLLQDSDAGSRFAGKEAIRALLTELTSGGHALRLMRNRNSQANLQTLSVDELMHLVEQGPAGLDAVPHQQASTNKMNQLHHRVELLLSDDLEAGRAVHREFARLSSRAREKALVPAGYRAKLNLGSVVRLDRCYLLCIQPRCDAVRLDGPTRFIFAPLLKCHSRFDLIVNDGQEDDVPLRLDENAAKLRHYEFEPDPDTRTVLTDSDAYFVDDQRHAFAWLCDLRDSVAQRFVQRIAASLSRIALDEFEWQRRHAKG